MPTILAHLTLLSTVTIPLPAAPEGSDWPQFRGPNQNGIAAPQDLGRRWTEGGPAELWRRPLGSGFSSITSVGDRLYTMAATDENEEVFCLDGRTGETLWQVPLGERFVETFGDGPRSTPTIDGDQLFAVSSTMQLAALSVEDGAVLWQIDLIGQYGIQQPRFGFSPSVTVLDDLAILEIGGGEGKAVVALDRDTGEVRWSALDGPPSASTPVLVEIDGVPQLLFSRRPDLVSLSLEGDVLWSYEGAPDVIVSAQFLPPNHVFTSSAQMGPGGVMLQVTRQDGEFVAEPVWINRRFRNHFNNSVIVDGHLYGFDNSTLRCVDAASGDIAWSERGLGKGSVTACGDLLFVLGDQGTLVLVAATPESYHELGRVQAMEGRCWTSPTLASGRLLLRNLEEIVAYDVRSAATGAAEITAGTRAPDTAPGAGAMSPDDVALEEVLERYARARGGLDRWREVDSLALHGTFSAFSASGPFTLLRQREDLYRFEYDMIGARDARGRDAEGPWWVYHLFDITEPARVEIQPYLPQLQRESMFEPALLAADEKGIEVEWIGPGEIDGRPTLDLRVTFPAATDENDGAVETWHLDASTCLELAVDSRVVDMTQAQAPMDRRTFYSDFREVDGLVMPFRLAMEFGARLEEFTIERVEVDPELGADAFTMPVPASADDAGDGPSPTGGEEGAKDGSGEDGP